MDKSKIEILEEKIIKEKTEWNKKIQDVVSGIRHIDNISETQVLMLSYRHILVEKYIDIKSLLGKQKSKNYVSRKAAYIKYKTGGHNLKLNSTEINEFIDADQNESLFTLSLLESYLLYLQMSIDTLDKLGFAIKNKISLQNHF